MPCSTQTDPRQTAAGSTSAQPAPQANEAKEAKKDSVNRLRATKAEWPEINRQVNSLRGRREQNHFAEMIRRTVLGEER